MEQPLCEPRQYYLDYLISKYTGITNDKVCLSNFHERNNAVSEAQAVEGIQVNYNCKEERNGCSGYLQDV